MKIVNEYTLIAVSSRSVARAQVKAMREACTRPDVVVEIVDNGSEFKGSDRWAVMVTIPVVIDQKVIELKRTVIDGTFEEVTTASRAILSLNVGARVSKPTKIGRVSVARGSRGKPVFVHTVNRKF